MRWFKHLSNGRRNPKIRKARRVLGEAAYGRYFALLEVLAEWGGDGANFRPKIAGDVDLVADELCVTTREAEETLDCFAHLGLIDAKAWRKDKEVAVPQMLEHRDEYTERVQRLSGHRLDGVRSFSGPSPTRAEGEQSKRKERRRREQKTISAAAWADIRLEGPIGSKQFQGIWCKAHDGATGGTPLPTLMERAILECNMQSVRVPPPFFEIKHKLECENLERSGLPADSGMLTVADLRERDEI